MLGEYEGRATVSVGEGGSSLIIPVARQGDAGRYRCKVALGTHNSREVVHTVAITGEPLIHTKTKDRITIRQGDDLSLSCNTSSETKVSWSREVNQIVKAQTKLKALA